MKKLSPFKISFIVLVVCIACILIASLCGKESTQSEEMGNYFDFEPVGDITEGQQNIYMVLKVLKSQYWQSIVDGAGIAATERGYNLYVGASEQEGDWQAQKYLLEEAVSDGADAILLSPANSTKLADTVNGIHDKIPVVLVDTILNDVDTFDACYMTDNIIAGELAGKEMLKMLKETDLGENEDAQIAIQIASVSSQTVIDRLAGFNQYWSANAPKKWKVIDEVKQNNGDKDVAKQNCIDLLNSYPNLKGVFGCNNSSTIGLVNGLKESGRTDVVLIGFDYADETAQLIASDDATAATIIQNQYDMGYQGLLKAVDILNSNEVDYKFVDTGTSVINHENYLKYENENAK